MLLLDGTISLKISREAGAEFMREVAWVIFLVLAVCSVPISKGIANLDKLLIQNSALRGLVNYAVGFFLFFWALWPIDFATAWMQQWQREVPPYDNSLWLKGAAIMLGWLAVTFQAIYRMGYKDGRADSKP